MDLAEKLLKVDYLASRFLWRSRIRAAKGRAEQREIRMLSAMATLDFLSEERVSFARFGDGECRLAFAQGETVYESWSRNGAAALRDVFEHPSEKVLVGFNNYFVSSSNWRFIRALMTSEKGGSYHSELASNDIVVLDRVNQCKELHRYLDMCSERLRLFGEASCFNLALFVEEYCSGRLEEVREKVAKVFACESPLLLCNPDSEAGGRLLLFLRSLGIDRRRIRIVHGPQRDGISEWQRWESKLLPQIDNHDLAIFQAGALATILVHRLALESKTICIDVGNISLRQGSV